MRHLNPKLSIVSLDTIFCLVIFYLFKTLANTADPDQTAPEEQSDQGLQCLLLNIARYNIPQIMNNEDGKIHCGAINSYGQKELIRFTGPAAVTNTAAHDCVFFLFFFFFCFSFSMKRRHLRQETVLQYKETFYQ